ncbi:hypothetical protein CRG98_030335 [Punica granatum]|uniref:Uncharacterized protein n=1 Tax=Punica granatum TaxID=22663 RepID=A0A2I0IZ68_PUNGR|nr:hypothetical protein CRG98_030335 [Punica granatum]
MGRGTQGQPPHAIAALPLLSLNSAPVTSIPVQTLGEARVRPLAHVRLRDSSCACHRALSCAVRPGRPLHACTSEDTARTRFEHTWWEDQTSIDCQSDIEQVLSAWHTTVTELPYFPKHPAQDERDFQATKEYILHFYWWSPLAHKDFTSSPQPEGGTPYGAPSSVVIQA